MWYSRHRRQGAEGHGRPALQRSPAPLQPISPATASWNPSASASTSTASASIRASTSLATKAPPTSTPTFSNSVTASTISSSPSSASSKMAASKSKSNPAQLPAIILHGFLLGTRAALFANDRQSLTITVNTVDARTVGDLIALFERAVGFYGTLVNINAYHQPGVEAGKKAAAVVLELQSKIVRADRRQPLNPPTRSHRKSAQQTRRKPSICCFNTWPPTARSKRPMRINRIRQPFRQRDDGNATAETRRRGDQKRTELFFLSSFLRVSASPRFIIEIRMNHVPCGRHWRHQ